MIPKQYTCEGENVSPALEWKDPPANTKSFVLIVEDFDTGHGTYTHWVLFNIPGQANGMASNKPLGIAGNNSQEKAAYKGPCPPTGIHRYYFSFYALDTLLDIQEGASKEAVLKAMEGHVLGQTQLMGRYTKNTK
jgi:Raf kinase inhibitor-like YbhB/YbcL family protein